MVDDSSIKRDRRTASAIGGAEGMIDAAAPSAAGWVGSIGGMLSSVFNRGRGEPSPNPERAARRAGRLKRRQNRR